ncbi:hypothetical protein LEMLEM_LOCUS210, partial [Lemmus lemmus]
MWDSQVAVDWNCVLVSCFLLSTRHNLESPGRREPQLWSCLSCQDKSHPYAPERGDLPRDAPSRTEGKLPNTGPNSTLQLKK